MLIIIIIIIIIIIEGVLYFLEGEDDTTRWDASIKDTCNRVRKFIIIIITISNSNSNCLSMNVFS